MLVAALDVFRLRRYFNVITRTRELAEGVRDDGRLLVRRPTLILPAAAAAARLGGARPGGSGLHAGRYLDRGDRRR
jgi:hypothetical protein